MSENVALVKRSFEAMGAWDVDALVRLYATDVEFLPLTGHGSATVPWSPVAAECAVVPVARRAIHPAPG